MADGVRSGFLGSDDTRSLEAAAPQWEPVCKAVDEELRPSGVGIRAVACTADAVVTASSRPVVKVWKVAEAKLTEEHKLRHGAVGSSCVEANAAGNLILVCSDDGGIGLWDLREKKRAGELVSSIPTSWKAKFLMDGFRIVSGGPNGSLCFWDLRKNGLESEINANPSPRDELDHAKRRRKEPVLRSSDAAGKSSSCVYSIALSNSGRLLGCGRGCGDISVMRVQEQEWAADVPAHHGETISPVRAVAFDAASRLLLSGGDDNHVCLLDAAQLARRRAEGVIRSPQLERFSAHRSWITSVSTCPDPARRVVLTTSWDSSVKLWDYRTQALLRSYKEHNDSVFASAFQPVEGRFFVTVGVDAQVALYVAKQPVSEALVPVSAAS